MSDSLDRILFLRDLPDDRSFTVRTSCRDADRYTSHRQLHRPGDDRNKLVRFARVLPLTLELRDPSGAAIPRLILIIDARSNDSSMMMALAFETDAEGRVSLEVPEDLHQLRFWSPNGGDVVARREWAGEPLLHLVHPVVTRAAELPR